MTDSDESLMLRCRDGDSRAFGVLLERHHRPVFRYLLRLTGDREAAEDLMQETFVSAYEARGAYTPSGRFTGWLYTIATNKARSFARSRRRPPAAPDPGVREPEAAYLVEELRGAVCTALGRLEARDREAILLREIAGLDHAELGAVLCCSPGAARVRAHRARRRLRELLAPYCEGQTGEAQR